MKFYIVQNRHGEVDNCYLLKREAVANCAGHGWSIHQVDCPVNKWTIRRILGGQGYAVGQVQYDYKGRRI